MGSWYWPGETEQVTRRIESAIFAGVGRCIQAQVLPRDYYRELGALRFLCDHGMNIQNGVLGAVQWSDPYTMRLSPIICDELNGPWTMATLGSISASIGIVVHELTHLAQIRWCMGFAWPVINAPVLCYFMAERWALENQYAAEHYLMNN